jgi:UPF0755 protein
MLETVPRRTERRRRGRERRRGLIILLAFVIFIGGAAAGIGAFYSWATGASGPRNKVTVVIPDGATGAQVADMLKQKDVIRSAFVFRIILKLRHLSGGFQAGQYDITTNMTVQQVLDALNKGPIVEALRVAFPEGLTIDQVAQVVHAKLPTISVQQFKKAATSGTYSLPPYLPAGTKSVEGFLSPNTYDFLKNATAADVITKLLGQFQVEARNLPWAKAQTLGLTDFQAVVVASMIEREAKFDVDRPLVAAVIYNRLKKGMALEIDATVQYALGTHRPITDQDKKVQSPYNTYLHQGVPPGPIASPGLASLVAALTPANVPYLYYVADSSGHNHYASTYQEFLRLKAKYVG